MTIHITLTPEEERKLTELASARGKDPAAHAHDVVCAYLNGANQTGTKSFEEIRAPIWEGWSDSGMTDGEVEELPDAEGAAELVITSNVAQSVGSIADAFGRATVLRSGDELLAQVRADRDEWDDR